MDGDCEHGRDLGKTVDGQEESQGGEHRGTSATALTGELLSLRSSAGVSNGVSNISSSWLRASLS